MVNLIDDMNILIYEGKNGTRVDLKSLDFETMWATQKQMGEIFDVEPHTINYHISQIYEINELEKNSTTRKIRVVQKEGNREIERDIDHYNLDMIIAVGYRVNSAKATQFRIWATKILKEYIVKGFAMDDERLKDPSRNQYFRELLERVREIRASEKVFYQQVKDIYATAIDYNEKKNSQEVRDFFAEIQNKLHYAITGKTAAELVIERHNINDKNFGLTNWDGSIVRQGDICIAKNYYTDKELTLLKLLVNSLLDHLELQSNLQVAIKLEEWSEFTDKLIEFNRLQVLEGRGKISHNSMKKIVKKDYKIFNNKRKEEEKEKAKKEAIEDLKKIEKEIKNILKTRKADTKNSKKEERENTLQELQNQNLNNPNAEKDLEKFAFAKPKK
jgi:hypothetical protein